MFSKYTYKFKNKYKYKHKHKHKYKYTLIDTSMVIVMYYKL